MPLRFRLLLAVSCLTAIPFATPLAEGHPQEDRIEKIVFTGNRTDERILRRRLPFKEGDVLSPLSLLDAERSLFDLRLFKSVVVSSASSSENGVDVNIEVKDGWYVIPFPFLSFGQGGGQVGLFLTERNYFRKAESLSLFGISGSRGKLGSVQAGWEGWTVSAAAKSQKYDEREYTDQRFSSSKGFSPPPDEGKAADFGVVQSEYETKKEGGAVSVGFPLLSKKHALSSLRGEVGWEATQVRYSTIEGNTPSDAGDQGHLNFSLLVGNQPLPGGLGDALGAILGFGLADLNHRIKPLPKPLWKSGLRTTYQSGAKWTGSNFNFQLLSIHGNLSRSWGRHNRIALNAAAAAGQNLPFTQRIRSGPSLAMTGTYARELRGDRGAGTSLNYSRPFRMTRRGFWQSSFFAESAKVQTNGDTQSKTGIGASFFYMLWRFPMPFGLSYTYAIDDKDSQLSAAVGGRF